MKRGVDRYFSGFIKEKVEKEGGKGYKTVMVYRGEYYKHYLTDKKWRQLKIYYLVMSLVSLAALIIAFLIDFDNDIPMYVTVPGLCTIFPTYFFVFGSVRNVFTKRQMIIRDYNASVVRIRWGALMVCIGAGITFAAAFISLFIEDGRDSYDVGTAVILLVGALSALAAYIREQRTQYIVKLPPEEEGLL